MKDYKPNCGCNAKEVKGGVKSMIAIPIESKGKTMPITMTLNDELNGYKYPTQEMTGNLTFEWTITPND